MPNTIALDKSVRRKDVDGQLFIDVSPISKACVSPYLGNEIPDADVLGLQMDKIYYLLRDPIELAKAADSFRGKPILIIHKPTSADDHPKELTVGAVGTDVTFNAPYLEASLCVWTAEAIAGIETKAQTEISSGYRYRADMTPGTYEGQPYDGVMRDIVGNHIALVDVGRAGHDVVVQDQKPLILRVTTMTKKAHLSRKAMAVNGALRAYLTPKLAQDAALGSLGKLLVDVKAATYSKQKAGIIKGVMSHVSGLKLAQDAKVDEKEVEAALDAMEDEDIAEDEDDETDEDKEKRLEAEKAAKSGAKDESDGPGKHDGDPKDKPPTKAAMDAAIANAVTEAVSRTEALHQAREDVAPMVGKVALDSAEAVYKFALDHAKIDTVGVHPSAYRSLVKMAVDRKPVVAPVIGMDAAAAKAVAEKFPGLSRFNKG